VNKVKKDSQEAKVFNEWDEQILRTIANQTAIAIEASQSMASAEVSKKQAEAWETLAVHINAYADQSWCGAAEQAMDAMEVELCAIYTVNQDKKVLQLSEYFCLDMREKDHQNEHHNAVHPIPCSEIPLEVGVLGNTAATASSYTFVQSETGELESGSEVGYSLLSNKYDVPQNSILLSIMTVPMRLPDGTVLGVLSFVNKQDTLEDTQQVDGFTENDQHIADALASLISQALRCGSLLHQQKDAQAQAEALRELMACLATPTGRSYVDLVDCALRLLSAECAQLFMLRGEEDKKALVVECCRGGRNQVLDLESSHAASIGQGAVGFCCLNETSLSLSLTVDDQGRPQDSKQLLHASVDLPPSISTVRSMALQPIIRDEICIGVLQVLNKRSSMEGVFTGFSEHDISELGLVTQVLAAVL